jgi:prophage regulatory protein
MRSEFNERIREVTALRKRAGEATLRIRREADLLAEIHHELADLLSTIVPLCVTQARLTSSSSSSSMSSRSSALAMTAASSSSSANVGPGSQSTRLLRIDAVAASLGLSRSQVWRMVKEGRFPKPRRLSTRAVGWLEAEVSGWISARPVFDGPHQPPPRARR